jgi:hypothetical protein
MHSAERQGKMEKIKIMISSRVNTEIRDGKKKVKLSGIRTELKNLLESTLLFEEQIYEVWVSEEPRDSSALESSWEECMSQVEKSDILLCIYTGEAGWAKLPGDIGICQAELETGINKEPEKVYIINAENAVETPIDKTNTNNKRMAGYVTKINRFYNSANSKDEIILITKEIIAQATIKLAKLGKLEARKGKYSFGEALDWTRMGFAERKDSIEKEIINQFKESGEKTKGRAILYTYKRKKYLFTIHGVPSSMSVNSAREMVGQPYLNDHQHILEIEDNVYGPIHIIGIHKGITETQATTILGHPDAIVVNGSFGIYIADVIQNIQMVFLANCRDSASTRHNVQKFISWLQESGEDEFLFKRAEFRRKILDVINKQISEMSS